MSKFATFHIEASLKDHEQGHGLNCPKIVRLLVVNVLVQILHVDVAGTTLSQTGVALTPHDASDPSRSSLHVQSFQLRLYPL